MPHLSFAPFRILARCLLIAAVAAVWTGPSAGAQEPEAAAAAPAQAPPQSPALANVSAQLADPATAERLKLTDEQRIKIAELDAERAEAIAKAEPGDRPKVVEEYEGKLQALLSDEQRAELAAGPASSGAEPKLRFNFRFQRWSDVLEWFADQAGLSLVLDAPPPGTFNYNDDREYSVAESLDLLNGVLLTKGYTLIRRERMLVLVDLAQGIPETLVPRIGLEELDKRGRFELVSVQFPLGNRDAAEVVTEITPLLSPRGKSQAMPKTRQVLVTDMAGVMRAIHAVIESMPEPKKPPAAEPPEKPQLVVYPVESADPDAAVEVLKALMPDAQFVRDPKANQISAYATPTQQAAAKRVIEQMQTADVPADQRARFEVYDLEGVDMPTALATFQPLVPTARLSLDVPTKKLAAWGTPADHEVLAQAVSQLVGGGGSGTDDRQVEVYRLSKADPVAVQTLLQNVVPRARLAVDAPTRSIVALASLADQQTIRATLEQIETQKPSGGAAELRFYTLDEAVPATLTSVLQSLVPSATVTVDAAKRRLAVVATPDDHTSVKAAINEYAKSSGNQPKRQLVLYPVSAAERARFMALSTNLIAEFPDIKVVTDAEPGELAVWASAEEHKMVANMLEQLKKESPAEETYQLVAYPVQVADPTSVYTVLTTMFPSTKIVLDAKSHKLVAWTRPAEQAAIKSLIEQMDTDVPGGLQSQLMVYPVAGFDPSTAITSLRSLVPDATLTSDPTARTIVAWARKSEHEQIAAALERMAPSADPERQPHVVSYSVGAADPNTLYPLVNALVPTARVVPNAASGTIAVWATPEDHEMIKGAIEEMAGKQSDSAAKVVVYTLEKTNVSQISQALQTVAPQARLGIGQNPRKLVVWARPTDHELIRSTLEELDTDELETDRNVLKAYPITTADAGTLIGTLQTLFATRPTVRLSLDAKNNKIVAMADPKEHETIQRVIAEVESGTPLQEGAQFEVHPLGNADPTTVTQVLGNLVGRNSRTQIQVDTLGGQLIAIAPPDQQKTIREAIERLQAAGRQLEVFQLDLLEPRAAEMAIQRLFTEGSRRSRGQAPTVESDSNTGRLYVRANQDDLTEIRDLLVQMGEVHLARSGGTGGKVRIIPFSGDAREAIAEIQQIWPRLHRNPLRVLSPSGSTSEPKLRPADDRVPAQKVVPPAKPLKAGERSPTRATEPATLPPAQSNIETPRAVVEVKTAAQEGEAPAEQAAPEVASETEASEPPAPAEQEAEPAPIIISPGDGSITIMSDDPEAIEQFETLLRSLSRPVGSGVREVTVYPLRSADSTTVADMLKRIFRRGAFDFGDSMSPVIEPDQRLNAVVVYAGRNDRAVIEDLLKVLDSEDIPESLVANRPMMIPVMHTDASAVERVLRDIYQTQLTSGSGRPKQQIPIPSGASRDVAAVIQQINTAATGPLMTMGVDEMTNSVVVMAPGPLAQEVAELVAELDEAALNDTSRSVKVVKLKNIEATQVKDALDRLIRDASQRQSSGRRRGR